MAEEEKRIEIHEMDEFEIDTRPGVKFRIKHIAPTKLLALQTLLDTSSDEKMEQLYERIFEMYEVEIAGVWNPVKTKDSDNFFPVDLATNFAALNDLANIFIRDFYIPLLRKSNESPS